MNSDSALMFVNLGTPKSFSVEDVRIYLREFLMDPCVIDIPGPLRWLLVNGIIAPFRSKKSAEAYQSIWTKEGSPLRVWSERLVHELRTQSGSMNIELAMRYGAPNIEYTLKQLIAKKIKRVYVFTAYPQYAMSSTETVRLALRKALESVPKENHPEIYFLESYARDKDFIESFAKNIDLAAKDFQPDHYLLSYHGLPIRHVKKIAKSCTGVGECSAKDTKDNGRCYRRQCFQTTEALVQRLGLKPGQHTTTFQSRLSGKWIQPFTDEVLVRLAQSGVRRLLVVCPSFTTDCLETLEEIGMRARESFMASGGEDLKLVPCLNADVNWAKAILSRVENTEGWTRV